MSYFAHPSSTLNEIFRKKPYQGADPMTAKFIFVGLDANYAADIEDSSIFPTIVEYLEDGVAFWKQHGVHHPFLLPYYKGDGRLYHRNFAKIEFQKENAAAVSFIELLHLASYGRSSLTADDLDHTHLQFLNQIILQGQSQFIFISTKVAALKLWHETGTKKVFWHYHFSVYGKFVAEQKKQLHEMSTLIHSTT